MFAIILKSTYWQSILCIMHIQLQNKQNVAQCGVKLIKKKVNSIGPHL